MWPSFTMKTPVSFDVVSLSPCRYYWLLPVSCVMHGMVVSQAVFRLGGMFVVFFGYIGS